MSDKKRTKPSRFSKEVENRFKLQVERMSQIGCKWPEIAHILWDKEEATKKELDTFRLYLEKRYIGFYTIGRSKLKANIRKAQIEVATQDKNPAMLIWLGKQMLGQSDNPVEDSEDFGFEFV